jgi:hypothetical protein
LYEQAKALLVNGKEVEVEVKEYKRKRSNEQNRYYWQFNEWVRACLADAGCTYGEFNLAYTKEIIHAINKRKFGVETTTKMNRTEFCEYMTQVSIFWIEQTNGQLEIPELPDTYLDKRGYTKEYMRE